MSATKRASYHLLASICQGLFGLVTISFIIPALSNKELGYIAALETLTYLFATVAGLNLDRAASRFYFNSDDIEYRKDVLFTVNIVAVISIVLGVLLVSTMRGYVVQIFPEVPFWPLVVLAITRISFEIAGRIEQSYLIASGQSGRYALGIVLSGSTSVGLSVVLVTLYKYGVIGYLTAQLTASILLSIYLFIASFQKRGRGRLDFSILSSAMSYAWPFIPTLIVAWVLSYYDRVLVNRFLGMEKLGIYALATTMAYPFLLVSGAVTKTILPTFYSVYNAEEDESPANHRLEFSRAVIYLLGFLALGALTVGSLVLEGILGSRVDHAIVYFGFLVVIYWVNSVGFLSSELLMLANATKLNMMISFFFAGLSLTLNYVLIQRLGIAGAIATGMTIAFLGFAVQLYAARKYIYGNFPAFSYVFILAILITSAYVLTWARDWRMNLLLFLGGTVVLGRGVLRGAGFFRRHG